MGLTEGERGFEQTKECYLTEVIPFFKMLKEHFEGIQKALTKEVIEMKENFEQMEAEVEQNAVDKKSAEIKRKNLLIENENLIDDCLSKEVFYTATDSVLTVSRFTEMNDAYTVAQKRIVELEAEISKLRCKIQKDDHSEMIKHFSHLEVEHLNLQLKYQHLKESFGNNKSKTSSDVPLFDSVFIIGKLKEQLQGRGNTIRELKEKISQMNEAENEKVKLHYKELYDSIKITRAKTIEKTSSLLTEIENLKAQIKGKMKCVTTDHVKPKVLTPSMYAIDVEPIPPRNRNNREVHLDYLKHLKESVETLREIIEEARAEKPLDSSLASVCLYTKQSQELLEYVIGTCPKDFNKRDKRIATTPLTRKKQCDKRKVIITESTIRRDLQLEDANGVDCLPNAAIFEQLTLMGTMASVIICLATNQNFNFSKYIFDNMVKNVDSMIFGNMKREGKGFSRRVTSLFQTMMVQAHEEMGEGSEIPTDPHHTPIITQPQRKQKSRKSKKKNIEVPRPSGSTDNVPDENVPTTSNDPLLSDSEIASLKKKVKKLEMRNKLRTPRLKRRMHPNREEIVDIDADAEEVEVEKVVSTAEVTTESATTTTVDELTLTQTLIEIKAVKPKVRGVRIQEPSEFTTTTTTTTPTASKPSQDKGKAKMIESEKPLKKKDQIMYDQEVVKSRAEGCTKRAGTELEQEVVRSKDRINAKVDLETLWKLVKAKHRSTRPGKGYERVLWGDLMTIFEPDVESLVWRTLQNEKVLIWKLFDSCSTLYEVAIYANLYASREKLFKLITKQLKNPGTVFNFLKAPPGDGFEELLMERNLMDLQDNHQFKGGLLDLKSFIRLFGITAALIKVSAGLEERFFTHSKQDEQQFESLDISEFVEEIKLVEE
ncbi:hypothetical protein Tco_0121327 [Tanacetum coccineum]